MRIVKLTKKTRSRVLREAVRVLKRGGVVVYPTETAYGIGVDATKRRAIKKVFAIKGRDAAKLLSVLMADLSMAREYATLSRVARHLWKRFLPGPLTLVASGKDERTVGIRVSSHPFARALVRAFGRPITSTSANHSGMPPLSDPERILQAFFFEKHKPDLIIDAGILPHRKPSTVVDCTGVSVRLLRRGAIPFSLIRKALRA